MSEDDPRVDRSVEIDATLEDVWRAISEGDLIPSWYAPFAEVEPGVGGEMKIGWGPDMMGSGKIEVWEPNAQLRIEQPAPNGKLTFVDFILEPRGGKTVLRLVHSGFGPDASWEDEIDGFDQGWALFLGNLKFFCEHHPGQPGRQVAAMALSARSKAEVWTLLTGEAWVKEGDLSGLVPGDRYALKTMTGEDLSGVVRIHDAPTFFSGDVEHLDHALYQISVEGFGEQTMVGANLFLWGAVREQADAVQARWTERFRALFGGETS